MPSQLTSYALRGMHAYPVHIEVDVAKGMPYFGIIGMASTSVKEAGDRVRGALKHSGFQFPMTRKIVNLAPAELPKRGSHYDLAIALGLLVASGQIGNLDARTLFVGELGLEGDLRPVRGLVPGLLFAKEQGFESVVLPEGNLAEAQFVDGLKVFSARNLKEVVGHVCGNELEELRGEWNEPRAKNDHDMGDITGHFMAKRALLIAAAGGHHVLMSGPPGSGKSLLARAFGSLLPPLSRDEALEVMQVHSVGQLEQVSYDRPFRTLHARSTAHQILGGGPQLAPGEISLAHKGVLFVDEFPELPRSSIEALRLPLEESSITLRHGNWSSCYPCEFQLIAAMNPCPCGYYGDIEKACVCPAHRVAQYQSKLSGPLLDRIDLHVDVPRLPYDELQNDCAASSAQLREQVLAAHELQMKRQGCLNSQMRPSQIRQEKFPDHLIKEAAERHAMSGRAIHRIIKVARSIADLAASENIGEEHLMEALQYRLAD